MLIFKSLWNSNDSLLKIKNNQTPSLNVATPIPTMFLCIFLQPIHTVLSFWWLLLS